MIAAGTSGGRTCSIDNLMFDSLFFTADFFEARFLQAMSGRNGRAAA
jgi:hypothetical protein